MAESEYAGPGLQMSAEIFKVVQAGLDFRELEKSEGYRRLLDFLKGRAAAALQAMRESQLVEDHVRLSLLFQWQLCEDVVRDIENHVRDSVRMASEATKELNMNELVREGFGMQFGVHDDE